MYAVYKDVFYENKNNTDGNKFKIICFFRAVSFFHVTSLNTTDPCRLFVVQTTYESVHSSTVSNRDIYEYLCNKTLLLYYNVLFLFQTYLKKNSQVSSFTANSFFIYMRIARLSLSRGFTAQSTC